MQFRELCSYAYVDDVIDHKESSSFFLKKTYFDEEVIKTNCIVKASVTAQ
jgi:hypothetical protein